MGSLWFWLVACMLAAYVIFDGFDLGVGVLYLFVARTEAERAQALRSIGPVWDGNEVWMLAASGTLFFAFPLLYASAFSGFYLPLMMVLWLLILRGLSIELRDHSSDILWRNFFDGLFSFASILLTLFFGAALGNIIRGVPIGADGYFFLPLWTNWRTGSHPGILDWYTVLTGLLAVAALALHGALYLALKTEGALERRAARFARPALLAVTLLSCIGIPATVLARSASLANYRAHPVAYLLPVVVLASVALMHVCIASGQRFASFLASCCYLGSMLLGAAAGLFPALLPAVGSHGQDITIARALSSPHTLRIGLVWWSFGMCLAVMYFGVVYRFFRGKVPVEEAATGH